MKSEHYRIMNDLTTDQKRLAQLNAEKASLEHNVDHLKTDIKTNIKAQKEVSKNMDKLTKDIFAKQQQLDTVNRQKEEKSRELKYATVELSRAEKTLADKESQLNKIQKNYNQLQERAEKAEIITSQLKSEVRKRKTKFAPTHKHTKQKNSLSEICVVALQRNKNITIKRK